MRFRRLQFVMLFFLGALSLSAQSLGNAGTIEGTVTDPSGASVPDAVVTIGNAVSGYKQSVNTARDGSFRLVNIPPNQYHLEVTAAGFVARCRSIVGKRPCPELTWPSRAGHRRVDQ